MDSKKAFVSAADSCKDMVDSCQDLADSCKQVVDSCKKVEDSCRELVDSSTQLAAMAADLLSSWERFKVQQAASTSSPTTNTTPQPTSTMPPPTSTTPPPTQPPQETSTPEEAPASYSIPTMSVSGVPASPTTCSDHVEAPATPAMQLSFVPKLELSPPAMCSTDCVNDDCDDCDAHQARPMPWPSFAGGNEGLHQTQLWPPPQGVFAKYCFLKITDARQATCSALTVSPVSALCYIVARLPWDPGVYGNKCLVCSHCHQQLMVVRSTSSLTAQFQWQILWCLLLDGTVNGYKLFCAGCYNYFEENIGIQGLVTRHLGARKCWLVTSEHSDYGLAGNSKQSDLVLDFSHYTKGTWSETISEDDIYVRCPNVQELPSWSRSGFSPWKNVVYTSHGGFGNLPSWSRSNFTPGTYNAMEFMQWQYEGNSVAQVQSIEVTSLRRPWDPGVISPDALSFVVRSPSNIGAHELALFRCMLLITFQLDWTGKYLSSAGDFVGCYAYLNTVMVLWSVACWRIVILAGRPEVILLKNSGPRQLYENTSGGNMVRHSFSAAVLIENYHLHIAWSNQVRRCVFCQFESAAAGKEPLKTPGAKDDICLLEEAIFKLPRFLQQLVVYAQWDPGPIAEVGEPNQLLLPAVHDMASETTLRTHSDIFSVAFMRAFLFTPHGLVLIIAAMIYLRPAQEVLKNYLDARGDQGSEMHASTIVVLQYKAANFWMPRDGPDGCHRHVIQQSLKAPIRFP